jgi:hypothetical protein
VFTLPILTPALATELMTKTPSDFLHLQSSIGIAGRWTRATSGHAAAAEKRDESWRRMGPSTPEDLYLPPRISDRKKHVSALLAIR